MYVRPLMAARLSPTASAPTAIHRGYSGRRWSDGQRGGDLLDDGNGALATVRVPTAKGHGSYRIRVSDLHEVMEPVEREAVEKQNER
jgi:hypothetical protein